MGLLPSQLILSPQGEKVKPLKERESTAMMQKQCQPLTETAALSYGPPEGGAMTTASEHALQVLREYVERQGTARKAAWALGVGPERISRWLHGKEPFSPTLTTLEKIAAAMSVSVAWLVAGEEAAEAKSDEVRVEAVTLDANTRDNTYKLGIVRRPLYINRALFSQPALADAGRMWCVYIKTPLPSMPRIVHPMSMLIIDRGPDLKGISFDDFRQGAIYLLRKSRGIDIRRCWIDKKEKLLVLSSENPSKPPEGITYGPGGIIPYLYGLVHRVMLDLLPSEELTPEMGRVEA